MRYKYKYSRYWIVIVSGTENLGSNYHLSLYPIKLVWNVIDWGTSNPKNYHYIQYLLYLVYDTILISEILHCKIVALISISLEIRSPNHDNQSGNARADWSREPATRCFRSSGSCFSHRPSTNSSSWRAECWKKFCP